MGSGGVVLTLIILTVFLIGIFGGLYYFYEKPQQDEIIVTKDLMIQVIDSISKEVVPSNILVTVDSTSYKNITTDDISFTLLKVPMNKTILIKVNTSNYYYLEKKEYFSGDSSRLRYIISMEKPGKAIFSFEQSYNKINLTIIPEGYIKNAIICLHWSRDFIYVKMVTPLKITSNLDNNYKCYVLDKDYSNKTYDISYSSFNEVTFKDYINLTIYDNDENFGKTIRAQKQINFE